MAPIDSNSSQRPHDGPARRRGLSWLGSTVTWFSLAGAGVAAVFVGLAIDASRHNNNANEQSLISFGNPGHLTAAVALVVAGASVLVGLTLSALRIQGTPRTVRRLAPVAGAWVAMAVVGIGSIAYIATSGATIGHGTSAPTATMASAEAIGIASALQQQGIATDTGASTDAAALPDAAAAHGETQPSATSGRRDRGVQPTFTQLQTMTQDQLLPLFPQDSMTAADFPAFKTQIDQVRQVALKYPTTADAQKAGYIRTTSDVPFMGEHYLNMDLVRKGIFDPARPQGLLFSKVDGGPEKLVGVWFLLIPGINGITRDVQPAGFAGNLDFWHSHPGLCLVGVSGASENETRESCTAKGGSFTADLRWMLHVWVAPETTENPDGVLAYLNSDLNAKQQAAAKLSENPTGQTP